MKKIGKIIKVIAFIMVFSICISTVSTVLRYDHEMQPNLTMKEFYDLEKDTIQMYVLGTSHTTMGFSPMECYKNHKITSFNLSTAAQPIEVSCYLLEEGLKKQTPEVVVLEIASLFYTSKNVSIGKFRYTLDSMPLSWTKFKLATCYANHNPDEVRTFSIGEALCPIYYYHDRWKELTEEEFDIYQAPPQLKGQVIRTYITDINYDLDTFEKKITKKLEKDPSAAPKIQDNCVEYLLKIKEMCEKKNIKLLLTSTPTNRWNSAKEKEVERICKEYDIDYLDMNLEDGELLDYSTDMADGNHVNASGAIKTTKFLCDYVIKNYGLKGKPNQSFEDSVKYYDAYYNNMINYGMETDFNKYLSLLNENKDKLTIFITSKGESFKYLEEGDVKQLKELGCQENLNSSNYEDSYIAVIDGGKLAYEKISEEAITDTYKLKSGSLAELFSEGHIDGSKTEIKIDGKDYAINSVGLNIVVLDKESNIVLDSVSFNTHYQSKKWYRSDERSLELFMFKSYRDWVAENY